MNLTLSIILFLVTNFTAIMSGGCFDLRKRWNELVGKSEKEAVEKIKQDGEKNIDSISKNKNNAAFLFH